jgi:FkbM family methyltransferase
MTELTTQNEAEPKPKSSWVRELWEQADWASLARLQLEDIAHTDQRAVSALFVASAHFHLGDALSTRTFLRQAQDWGADRSDTIAILMSGARNSLGRIALVLGENELAKSQFLSSISDIQKGDGAEKTAFIRQFHEMLNLGLMPDAAKTLTAYANEATRDPEREQAWATIIDTKIEQLNHVLSLSLEKGQLTAAHRTADIADDSVEHARARSVAQLDQDVWVLEQTGFKRDGFFVEFGATNGILLSNTYLLESAYDWSGICAEPNPEFYAQLQRNRSCIVSSDCIAGETGKTVEFIAADEFGGFAEYADHDMHADKRQAYAESGKVLELTTISLHDFLKKSKAPKTIDYLSIDTEGSEYEILASFPFEKWDIRLITVEHNFTPMRDKIFDLLTEQGYVRTEMQWDDWYAKADQLERG